jgi:parallel beta-helix repeat protein
MERRSNHPWNVVACAALWATVAATMAVTMAVTTTAALAGPALAGTYHVAPHGSDRGKGSEDRPWKTLIHAVNQLGPGDTLIVAPGRYAGFYLRKRNSGTPGARVRIVARDGAIIDRMLGNGKDGINIEYASYIDVEGFTVTNAPRAGIRAVECLGVRIRNNKTHDNGRWGIFTGFCDDLLIENNEMSGSRREHGVYVSNSSRNPIIRGNRIHGNAMNGIHTNGDASMGRGGMTTGALIENNIIYGNGRKGGAAINNDGIRDSVIRNNLIFLNHANGITLYRIDGKHPSTGNKVLNNTIVMPDRSKNSRWCIRIADGSTGNVFKNNICINGHHYRGAIDISEDSLPGFVSDHNILDGRFTLADGDAVIPFDAWRARTGQDGNSTVLEYDARASLFMNPARGDYRLRDGCAAIGRGDPGVAPEIDYAGLRRKRKNPDVGALEFCAGACEPISEFVGPALAQAGVEAGDSQAGDSEAGDSQAGEATGSGTATDPATDPATSPVPRGSRSGGGGCCSAARSGPGALGGMFLLAVLVMVVLLARPTPRAVASRRPASER